MPQQGMEAPQDNISPEQAQANVEAVMQAYQVDKQTAAGVLEAERQGYTDEEISTAFGIPLELIMQNSQQQEPVNVQG
jgi:hypothetical protein